MTKTTTNRGPISMRRFMDLAIKNGNGADEMDPIGDMERILNSNIERRGKEINKEGLMNSKVRVHRVKKGKGSFTRKIKHRQTYE